MFDNYSNENNIRKIHRGYNWIILVMTRELN